jgi:hypothetical protein
VSQIWAVSRGQHDRRFPGNNGDRHHYEAQRSDNICSEKLDCFWRFVLHIERPLLYGRRKGPPRNWTVKVSWECPLWSLSLSGEGQRSEPSERKIHSIQFICEIPTFVRHYEDKDNESIHSISLIRILNPHFFARLSKGYLLDIWRFVPNSASTSSHSDRLVESPVPGSLPTDLLSCNSILELIPLVVKMSSVEYSLSRTVNHFSPHFPIGIIEKFMSRI